MKNESIRLAWIGAVLGVLVLSATVFAKTRPPVRRDAGSGSGAPEARAAFASEARAEGTGAAEKEVSFSEDEAAVPVMAEEAPRRFSVALRLEAPVKGRLFLCDAEGCPLEEISTDAGGAAALGPLVPGQYSLYRGETELGRFRLLENAALARAEGLLRTDGLSLVLAEDDP